MKKEIEINGKKMFVKELKYKDIFNFSEDNKEESAKKMMLLSTGMTDEEFNELGLSDGLKIQKLVNEVNGLVDFQKPQNV